MLVINLVLKPDMVHEPVDSVLRRWKKEDKELKVILAT